MPLRLLHISISKQEYLDCYSERQCVSIMLHHPYALCLFFVLCVCVCVFLLLFSMAY